MSQLLTVIAVPQVGGVLVDGVEVEVGPHDGAPDVGKSL
jgi:hypothetical protein